MKRKPTTKKFRFKTLPKKDTKVNLWMIKCMEKAASSTLLDLNIGMFVENQKQGMGSFYYSADEYEYHGEWSNDKREGNGVFLSTQETN